MHVLWRILWKNWHLHGFVSFFSNSYNLREPSSFHLTTRILVWNGHTKSLLRRVWWEPLCSELMSIQNYILFSVYSVF